MAYEMGQTKSLLIILIMSFFLNTEVVVAEPKHGIAMYGEPALPHDFVSLPYANPNAPTTNHSLCTVFWPNQLRLMKPETGLNLH